MPLYQFEHIIQLSTTQKATIARTITDWHATTFKAPRFIVQCRFIDVSQGLLADHYVGGAPRQINRVFLSLRSGTGRTQEQLQGMADKISDSWDDVVGQGSIEQQLRGVYIQGNIDSAKEAGFHLPMVCIALRGAMPEASEVTMRSLESSNNGSRTMNTSSRNGQRRVTLMRSRSSEKFRPDLNFKSRRDVYPLVGLKPLSE